MITLRPYGGLGNRMRSVDSGIALAECTGKKLKVIWDANEELNAAYSSLFQPAEGFEVEEISTNYFPRKVKEKLSILLHKLSINYPFSYSKVLHETDIYRLKDENYDFCGLGKWKTIYIHLNGRFLFPKKPYSALQPVDDIEKRVQEVTAGYNAYTLGVHIRRSDNKQAIENSPLEKFEEIMDKRIQENDKVNFFLSTDSGDAEREIRAKYGDRIMSYSKELRRDKQDGIRDAFIDILCLSRTSRIIGSFYSSFSEVASEIGGIELEIATKGRD